MTLKTGDWVEVRTKREVLASLDAKGCLDGLPFMPEMLQYCGQRFRVYKRAHKTCDTVTGTGGRRLPDGIHLDLRCAGKAHGNCEAACLLFWKEAWLRPADGPNEVGVAAHIREAEQPAGGACASGCSEHDIYNATSHHHLGETKYVCQATELPRYTSRLRWWNLFQYIEDYSSGNVTGGRLLRGFIYASFSEASYRMKRLAPLLQGFYDRIQALWGGLPYPRRTGTIPVGQPTPTSTLNLQAGDLVRVKSYDDILATLNSSNKNAGLFFDAELVPYCGGTYRVKARVHQFIDEATGKMSYLKTPAVILDRVWCQSRYSSCRMFCPRSIYSWWREVWLERVPDEVPLVVQDPPYGQQSIKEPAKQRLVGASASPAIEQLAGAPHREVEVS
jgi:hypothetical protein